jgi:2-phospho-L-lactate guanylyltransferase
VPVKDVQLSKTRLDNPPGYPAKSEFAHAFALDTVAALITSPSLMEVFVVTSDVFMAEQLSALGAAIVNEPLAANKLSSKNSLNAAITLGIETVRILFPAANIAIFTSDLPALTVEDIGVALAKASVYDRSLVADAEGLGTSVLLFRPGVEAAPQFGSYSRTAHERSGHVVLDLPQDSSIRRDVDTPADLEAAIALGVGVYTRELMEKTSAAIAAVVSASRIHKGTASERIP